MNSQENSEKILNHIKTLQNQVYIQDDVLIINVAYEYTIALERCDTYEKILGWVFHLLEKTWMTNDVARRFISLACKHHNLERPSAP